MHIYAGQVSGVTVEDETFCAPKNLNSYQVLTVVGVLVVTEIALTTYRSKYKCMNSSYISVLMAATLVARNAKEIIVVPVVGSGGDCIWQQSGV
jgi:hypothetical protein